MAATLTTAVKGGDLTGCVRALFNKAPPSTEVEWVDSQLIKSGKGPLLHCALSLGHLEVSKLLVVAGADLAAGDKDGYQPLHWAGIKGHTELAAGMLDRGADIEAKDEIGATPLFIAAVYGRPETEEMLLDRGADIEAEDKFGNTPLNWAAITGHSETAELLLDRGADIEATDNRGRTPLMSAVTNSHPRVVTLLLDRGADITRTDELGSSAYHWTKVLDIAEELGPAVVARLKPPSPAAIAAANADAAEATSTAALGGLRAGLRRAAVLSLAAFSVLARVGHRTHPHPTSRYHGCNSAVFRAVLRAAAAAVIGGGVDVATLTQVTLKVIYNFGVVDSKDLSKTFVHNFAITEDPDRRHPNLLCTFGHFVGTASTETLGMSWNLDPDFVRPRTLFIVMEYLDLSLEQLISRRVLKKRENDNEGADEVVLWPPVLAIVEFLLILQRLLRAVCHLLRCGVVHRDIKPDNILLANPDTVNVDVDASPTIVKLADLGEALDTVADKIENFKMPYINRDTPKGGAPTHLAPEVMAATHGTLANPRFIDYSKNDVFAVGMVAHHMLTSGTQNVFSVEHPNYSQDKYTHPPEGCPAPIADLVWAMVNPSFEHRITADEALARVDALIEGPELRWE